MVPEALLEKLEPMVNAPRGLHFSAIHYICNSSNFWVY